MTTTCQSDRLEKVFAFQEGRDLLRTTTIVVQALKWTSDRVTINIRYPQYLQDRYFSYILGNALIF